jgi:hypothetical protein
MSPKQKSRRTLLIIALVLLIIGIPLDFFVLRSVGLRNIRLFPVNENVCKAVIAQNERAVRSQFPLDSFKAGSNRILDDSDKQYLSLVVFGKASKKDSLAYLVLVEAPDKKNIRLLSVQPASIPPSSAQLSMIRRSAKQ